MKGSTIIRQKLGISQLQMAEWLGVSRSLLTYYENGSRKLSTPALLKLARLEIMIHAIETKKAANDSGGQVTGRVSSIPVMNNSKPIPETDYLFMKAASLEKRLTEAGTAAAELEQCRWLLQQLLETAGDDKTYEGERLWFTVLIHEVSVKIVEMEKEKKVLGGKLAGVVGEIGFWVGE
jgi:transcriptional regulator with XRE-family HTH domain